MADDRTGELIERVEKLDAMHDDWLRRGQLALGTLLVRSSRFKMMRRLIAGPLSRVISYCMVERGMLGIVPGRKRDVLDIAENWLKVPTFIRMPYRIEEATDERVVVAWPECAVGYTDPCCLQACETAMNIDIWVVKRMGGRLTVTENMLKGAPACKFEITKL